MNKLLELEEELEHEELEELELHDELELEEEQLLVLAAAPRTLWVSLFTISFTRVLI